MSGVIFAAGALIALDRDDRRVIVLLARAAQIGARVTVPASAWRKRSGSRRGKRVYRAACASRTPPFARSTQPRSAAPAAQPGTLPGRRGRRGAIRTTRDHEKTRLACDLLRARV
jgi:hypothetical protein